MRKLLIIVAFILFLAPKGYCIFGLKGLIQNELSLLKQDIQGDVNGLKSDIKEMKVSLESMIQANINTIAGFNNQLNNLSAGRDNINIVTDPKLMYGIICGLLSVILYQMRTKAKMTKSLTNKLLDMIKEKKKYKGMYYQKEKELEFEKIINGGKKNELV